MRTRAAFLPIAAAIGCGDAPPAVPAHATHAMVGRYELQATFTSFRPDVRRLEVVPADATIAGTVVIADTVEARQGSVFFPDVRIDAAFCATRATCGATQSYASFTSWFGAGMAVTLGFSGPGGVPTLHFDGPFAGDSLAGPAYYQIGTARYEGRFVARKR